MNGRRDLGAAAWRERLAAEDVTGDLADRLAEYLVLLGRFGSAVDLVSAADAEQVVRRHIVRSLVAVRHLPSEGRLVDIGSGNGFPAVPLLLAIPGLEGTLLEPRERRWAFLSEVSRSLGLRAEVLREDVRQHRGSGYAAMTVRAVHPRVWQGERERLLAEGGVLVWWAGVRSRGVAAGWGGGCVVTSPGLARESAEFVVWRRCST